MEKKVKDKIEKAGKLLDKQIAINEENKKAIYAELLTPEIKQMLNVIVDSTYCDDYTYRGKDNLFIKIHKGYSIKCTSGNGRTNDLSRPWYKCEYTDAAIRTIEKASKNVLETSNYIELISKNAKGIIEDITNKYKEITETQADKLDAVLERLGADIKPIKHIKVTVEWV